MQKLQVHEIGNEQLLPREKLIVSFIQNHPGSKSGDIAKGVNMSGMIVIRQLSALINKNVVKKHGSGSATQYTAR